MPPAQNGSRSHDRSRSPRRSALPEAQPTIKTPRQAVLALMGARDLEWQATSQRYTLLKQDIVQHLWPLTSEAPHEVQLAFEIFEASMDNFIDHQGRVDLLVEKYLGRVKKDLDIVEV